MILLDTHIWIWFNIAPEKLPMPVALAFDEGAEEFALSAASIWEALVAIEKGRVVTQAPGEETVRSWLSASPIQLLTIDTEVVFLSRALAFTHDDPADRFIAATAIKLGCPLATVDQRLRSLSWLRTMPLA